MVRSLSLCLFDVFRTLFKLDSRRVSADYILTVYLCSTWFCFFLHAYKCFFFLSFSSISAVSLLQKNRMLPLNFSSLTF